MEAYHRYWIGFNLVKGIGPSRTRALLEYFPDLETAWNAPRRQLKQAGLGDKLASIVVRTRKETDLEGICADLDRRSIGVLCWQDPGYPRRLLAIDHPPPVIYLRGALSEEDLWAVSIVGTRRTTSYGRQVAVELAEFLAGNGITVVSGLARGVDTIAHETAIRSGGRTIGVLGCGVEQIYPPENRRLAAEMLQTGRGVLISDYPVGTPPEGPNFPPRNRIISGLSLAVVVVEAGARSGALITASFALEQGREIFAVPGSIMAPQSIGTNRLISNGAHPYLKPEDVLDVLEWVRVVQYPDSRRATPEPGLEARLYQLMQREALHMDELSASTGIPVDRIAAALTVMELKGLVRQVNGLKYISV